MLVVNLLGTPATTIVLATVGQIFFGITMTVTAIFLILLVLVQRGRGGGLAGAFGGMGGQSAFGTKAGDTFTKVTIGVSIFWILLCVASVKFLGTSSGSFGQASAPEQTQVVPGPEGPAEPVLPAEDGGVPGEGGLLPGAGAPASEPSAEITPETPTDATGTQDEAAEENQP